MDSETQAAIEQCWRAGDLTYLLHDGQLELYELIRAQQQAVRDGDTEAGRKFAANVHRRFGKSWLWLDMAIEDGFRIERGLIRYAAPTEDQVTGFLLPLADELLAECPEDIKPQWQASRSQFYFPTTGAILKLSGMHTRRACDAQRGTGTHRAYLDEAAFSEHLDYMIGSVLMPQCLTTNGTILVASTPPETPAHPFVALCHQLASTGKYFHRTIHNSKAPHITPSLIEEFKAECGGEHTTKWRREFLCEFVIDDETAIVPEFTAAESTIVEEVEAPVVCDRYVVADIGFVDLSFWLFGYYDFQRALWCVEDELVFRNTSLTAMVRAAREKERELWWSKLPSLPPRPPMTDDVDWEVPPEPEPQPYARFADVDALVLAEMSREQRYRIGPVRNDDLDAAVNALRLATYRRKYRVHPRCKQLIAHLKAGVWNTARTGFARMGSFGHFDGVAAAMYFERHVNRTRNPMEGLPAAGTPEEQLAAARGRRRMQGKTAAALGSRWRR